MATCPAGHDSAATDYCDVSGAPLNGAALAAGEAPATEAAPAPEAGAAGEPCPDCGAELEVLSVAPLELALAPEIQDDWGE